MEMDPAQSTPAHTQKSAAVELTAIILTLNEASHIVDCIASLDWADRVVVFDSFSIDGTIDLAQQAGAEIYQHPFANYAQQRNAALDAVDTDWVFFVDADERGTPDLGAEILRVIGRGNEPACAERGWNVPRRNYIFGKLTTGAGWFPDYQLRLFKHGLVRYEREVHEIAQVEGAIGDLQHPLIHYNYAEIEQFKAKQRAYTSFDARMLKDEGVRPRPHNFILQPLRQFLWRYITLQGYKDGWHGLQLSLFMMYYEWVKYRKLAWFWRKER